MRVLHVFNEIKYSGAEIMYFNAAPLFNAQGIEMLALNSGAELGEFALEFESINIKVYFQPIPNGTLNPLFILRYFRDIYKLLGNERIDVLHIHRSTFFLFFAFIGYIRGLTVVRTVHNVFKSRKFTWFKAYLDRLIARVVFDVKFQTIGDSVYNNELNYYNNPSIKINNWYNNQKFFPANSNDEKNKLRKHLDIPIDAFVIISTGSCTCVKNHHDIIKALALVRRLHNCHYLHLGKGETLDEEKALCEDLGLSKNVDFLGNQRNVRDYLVASDIYVMPSMFEGLSIAAIEAMACALPSVLYRSPGLVDLINDDDNGYLIDRDSKVMAESISSLIENPLEVNRMGMRAYSFVKQEFSIEKGVQKVIEIYKQQGHY
jgi:glycosyltransferase involved in cell wall biosynthesis